MHFSFLSVGWARNVANGVFERVIRGCGVLDLGLLGGLAGCEKEGLWWSKSEHYLLLGHGLDLLVVEKRLCTWRCCWQRLGLFYLPILLGMIVRSKYKVNKAHLSVELIGPSSLSFLICLAYKKKLL